MLDISQTSPPPHVEVELQAQPTMSVLHVWHRLVPSQYALVLQNGPWLRHGHPGVPATQVSGTQVPLLQLRPAAHMSPLPHAQPFCPAGHVSQAPDAHRRPMSHVLLARQTHAAAPRWHDTHAPLTHSPDEQAPAWHPQPTVPGAHAEPPPVPPPESIGPTG